MIIRKNTISIAAAACWLLITNSSQGMVDIVFEQVTDDVIATVTGSIQLPSPLDTDFPNVLTGMSESSFGSSLYSGLGAPAGMMIGGNAVRLTSIGSLKESIRLFGNPWHFRDDAFWVPDPFSAGMQYDLSGRYSFNNATLSSLGVTGFSNTLAFTTSDGQEIRYSTIPIPEPTCALFTVIGFLTLSSRRSRRIPYV